MSSISSFGQTISGTVFRDFNSDGTYTAIPASGTYAYGEPGVGGVTVTVYNAIGQAVATTTSSTVAASSGNYTLTVGNTSAYRIEFTDLPSADYESFRGTSSATSVQFVTGGSTSVNFGVNYPVDYCQSNPNLVLPCYENGSGATNTNPAIVSFPYTSSGKTSGPTENFDIATVGTIWGLGYQKTKKRTYAGAFLKRHSGLGPRGMDGVYILDYTSSAPTLLGGFDLEGVVPSNGGSAIRLGSVTRTAITTSISSGTVGNLQLPASSALPSIDLDAYGKVGTVGYGDLDVSEDGNTLWMVNLYQKALIAVDIANLVPGTANPNTLNSSLVKQYSIASMLNVPSCTNGQLRPFGLSFYRDKGYLGLVCDASTNTTVRQPADLKGYVVSFNPASPTAFTLEATIPLNYNREPYYQNFTTGTAVSGAWQRWNNTWTTAEVNTGYSSFISSPQPLLSDIDFSDNGSMIVSLLDRFSHQVGWQNYRALSGDRTLVDGGSAGDILYLGKQGNTYVAELGENDPGNPSGNASAVGFLSTDGVNSTGEFFYGDYYLGSDATHHETALGSAAIFPGKNEVTDVALDPLAFNSMGVRWLSTSLGKQTRAYQVVGNTAVENFGKGGGLGDIELLCNPAPVEVGNRVWLDTNNNGIQDAGETPLAGVTVTLKGPGLPATGVAVTTSTQGEYYFSNTTGINTLGFVYSLTGLTSGSAYSLSFPTSVSTAGGTANLSTKPNAATGTNADQIDTDANVAGIISFTLGQSGQNNFSYDAGYTQLASLGDYVFEDVNTNGQQDAGDKPISGVTVTLLSSGTVVATTTTNSSGLYSFTGLTPGVPYSVSFTAPAGFTATTQNTGNDATDSDGNPTTGLTAAYSLTANENNLTIDMGYVKPASLGDYVFLDANKNGIQDAGDTPISGVTVTLYTNGVASATTVTNASGLYSFSGLTPGNSLSYSVGFTAPAGLTATIQQAVNNDALDSDANPTTGLTQSITLAAGEFNANLDAGFYPIPTRLMLTKLVNKSKASVGDTLTYTLVLSNIGSTTATITVRDSLSAGVAVIVGSASAPPGTTFAAGKPLSLWTVPSIGAGQRLTLTFQAIADSSGILYNTAMIPGDTSRVCTSVPIKVCQGDIYTFRLTAATGRASYRWYKDGVEITGQTANVLDVTAPGSYSLGADNTSGLCRDFSCCPLIIEEDSLPVFQANVVPVTCLGNTPQQDGQIIISNFKSGNTYQYAQGAAFEASQSLSGAPQLVPANGVIAGALTNPSLDRVYTVRVFNHSGCYIDRNVTLAPTVCPCPASICVPIVVSQIKRGQRSDDPIR